MAVSARLRTLVRDAHIGLTDLDICERTGLNLATLRRMVQGYVPSDAMLIKLALGLDLEPAPFLDAAREVRPPMKAEDILRFGLERSPLSAAGRMAVMEVYRERLQDQELAGDQSSEAAA